MSSSAPFKLYYTPTSCGAASFIVAHYGGLKFDAETVDLPFAHKTASGADFYTINPKGNVPTIVLADGRVVNENVATLTYLADKAAAAGKVTNLIPAAGTDDRYVFLSALAYIASEVHQSFGPVFRAPNDEAKEKAKEVVYKKWDYLEKNYFTKHQFLTADHFTAVDSYLYIVLAWHARAGLTLDKHPKLKAYFERVKALDFVQAAHKKMGELAAAEKKQ